MNSKLHIYKIDKFESRYVKVTFVKVTGDDKYC